MPILGARGRAGLKGRGRGPTTDLPEEVRKLGVEFAIKQVDDLLRHGEVHPLLHHEQVRFSLADPCCGRHAHAAVASGRLTAMARP